MTSASDTYNAQNITILEGLEAVRKRPGMYIGSTDARGLHHLVYEVVDNSVDEAMAGHCNKITVKLHVDNSVTVSDNGRGIPVDIHEGANKSAVEVVLTVLHAGGKFDGKMYEQSGGLHGVGVSVVNALSKKLEVTVKRNNKKYRQKYERGNPINELEVVGESTSTGTTIRFLPDDEIFEVAEYQYSTLRKRFEEVAYLNEGLTIELIDERENKTEVFKADGGLKQYVTDMNAETGIHDAIFGEASIDKTKVSFAMQYNDGFSENIITFANNIRTHEGGTHLQGFKTALTRAINSYIQTNDMKKKMKITENLSGEDSREGLTAVISVKLSEPQFEGQTKTKLGNSEIAGIVTSLVYDKLVEYFEQNAGDVKLILEKVVTSAKAREAAKRARNLVRRKSVLLDSTLPGKLADCQSKSPEESEIFIVEGDSAGGSAKQGRNPKFQAILPLRGKILNVEKTRLTKALANKEIQSLIAAIGAGVSHEKNIDKTRYHKIVIMTDADVDGAHIRTLILTLFFRHFRELIERGYVYIAQPPLYRVHKGKSERYIKDDNEMTKFLVKNASKEATVLCTNGSSITGKDLEATLSKVEGIQNSMREAERMGLRKNIFNEILQYDEPLDGQMFSTDSDELSEFISFMKSRGYNISINTNEDDDAKFIIFDNGKMSCRIGAEFFNTKTYTNAFIPFQHITTTYGYDGFLINPDTDKTSAENLYSLFDKVLEVGKKGFNIQRYKGLGEMNPEQLWDTTMNPENRTFLQVKIDDYDDADLLFSQLMGDKVAPRKKFIEDNAEQFTKLDI